MTRFFNPQLLEWVDDQEACNCTQVILVVVQRARGKTVFCFLLRIAHTQGFSFVLTNSVFAVVINEVIYSKPCF